MEYLDLADPQALGAHIIEGFASREQIAAVNAETNDPGKLAWLDAHETYTNQRGLIIVQNHFTYALKLSTGNQSPLEALPATVAMHQRIERFITGLAPIFPSLATWKADELSFHLYDDQEVGLSQHKDNTRFIGLIAIMAIDGECDLVINHHGEDTALTVRPGDLSLLRAPGLIEAEFDIRPEHSVQNLRTPTRLSMMVRANSRPHDAIPGFRFNNWDGQAS
jgi:hypothetical protein